MQGHVSIWLRIYKKVLDFLKLSLKDRMEAGKLDVIPDLVTLVSTVSSTTIQLSVPMLQFKLAISIATW